MFLFSFTCFQLCLYVFMFLYLLHADKTAFRQFMTWNAALVVDIKQVRRCLCTLVQLNAIAHRQYMYLMTVRGVGCVAFRL